MEGGRKKKKKKKKITKRIREKRRKEKKGERKKSKPRAGKGEGEGEGETYGIYSCLEQTLSGSELGWVGISTQRSGCETTLKRYVRQSGRFFARMAPHMYLRRGVVWREQLKPLPGSGISLL